MNGCISPLSLSLIPISLFASLSLFLSQSSYKSYHLIIALARIVGNTALTRSCLGWYHQGGRYYRFLEPGDLEIWRMTLKNNRAPLLCYFKLYASFRSHRWIQAGVTVRKRPIWVKIDDFFSRVTLKFDVLPWKTIGHLYYATSSFVHHFVAIGEFELELESGNAQSWSNLTLFRAVWPWNLTDDLQQGKSEGFESCDRPIVQKRPIWVKMGDVLYRVTLKFDGWTIGHLSFAVSSFVQHFIAVSEFKLELVRKGPIWVKFDDFQSRVTLKFDLWPWKTIGHLYFATSSLVHHFVAIGVFKLELRVRKRPIWVKFDDF